MQGGLATEKDLDPTLDDEEEENVEKVEEKPIVNSCFVCGLLGAGPNQDKPLK